MIHFDLPKEKSSILKVIGVGGGGGNAVNHMFSQQIEGVNFIICNTDAQALANSGIPNRVQLGPHLTQGLVPVPILILAARQQKNHWRRSSVSSK